MTSDNTLIITCKSFWFIMFYSKLHLIIATLLCFQPSRDLSNNYLQMQLICALIHTRSGLSHLCFPSLSKTSMLLENRTWKRISEGFVYECCLQGHGLCFTSSGEASSGDPRWLNVTGTAYLLLGDLFLAENLKNCFQPVSQPEVQIWWLIFSGWCFGPPVCPPKKTVHLLARLLNVMGQEKQRWECWIHGNLRSSTTAEATVEKGSSVNASPWAEWCCRDCAFVRHQRVLWGNSCWSALTQEWGSLKSDYTHY